MNPVPVNYNYQKEWAIIAASAAVSVLTLLFFATVQHFSLPIGHVGYYTLAGVGGGGILFLMIGIALRECKRNRESKTLFNGLNYPELEEKPSSQQSDLKTVKIEEVDPGKLDSALKNTIPTVTSSRPNPQPNTYVENEIILDESPVERNDTVGDDFCVIATKEEEISSDTAPLKFYTKEQLIEALTPALKSVPHFILSLGKAHYSPNLPVNPKTLPPEVKRMQEAAENVIQLISQFFSDSEALVQMGLSDYCTINVNLENLQKALEKNDFKSFLGSLSQLFGEDSTEVGILAKEIVTHIASNTKSTPKAWANLYKAFQSKDEPAEKEPLVKSAFANLILECFKSLYSSQQQIEMVDLFVDFSFNKNEGAKNIFWLFRLIINQATKVFSKVWILDSNYRMDDKTYVHHALIEWFVLLWRSNPKESPMETDNVTLQQLFGTVSLHKLLFIQDYILIIGSTLAIASNSEDERLKELFNAIQKNNFETSKEGYIEQGNAIARLLDYLFTTGKIAEHQITEWVKFFKSEDVLKAAKLHFSKSHLEPLGELKGNFKKIYQEMDYLESVKTPAIPIIGEFTAKSLIKQGNSWLGKKAIGSALPFLLDSFLLSSLPLSEHYKNEFKNRAAELSLACINTATTGCCSGENQLQKKLHRAFKGQTVEEFNDKLDLNENFDNLKIAFTSLAEKLWFSPERKVGFTKSVATFDHALDPKINPAKRVWYQIFTSLKSEDLGRLSQTCKYFFSLYESYWHSVYSQKNRLKTSTETLSYADKFHLLKEYHMQDKNK